MCVFAIAAESVQSVSSVKSAQVVALDLVPCDNKKPGRSTPARLQIASANSRLTMLPAAADEAKGQWQRCAEEDQRARLGHQDWLL